MEPGNSADVAIARLPGRANAVLVKGAKAPTASTWPAANAAAAASVASGTSWMSCWVRLASASASNSR